MFKMTTAKESVKKVKALVAKVLLCVKHPEYDGNTLPAGSNGGCITCINAYTKIRGITRDIKEDCFQDQVHKVNKYGHLPIGHCEVCGLDERRIILVKGGVDMEKPLGGQVGAIGRCIWCENVFHSFDASACSRKAILDEMKAYGVPVRGNIEATKYR